MADTIQIQPMLRLNGTVMAIDASGRGKFKYNQC